MITIILLISLVVLIFLIVYKLKYVEGFDNPLTAYYQTTTTKVYNNNKPVQSVASKQAILNSYWSNDTYYLATNQINEYLFITLIPQTSTIDAVQTISPDSTCTTLNYTVVGLLNTARDEFTIIQSYCTSLVNTILYVNGTGKIVTTTTTDATTSVTTTTTTLTFYDASAVKSGTFTFLAPQTNNDITLKYSNFVNNIPVSDALILKEITSCPTNYKQCTINGYDACGSVVATDGTCDLSSSTNVNCSLSTSLTSYEYDDVTYPLSQCDNVGITQKTNMKNISLSTQAYNSGMVSCSFINTLSKYENCIIAFQYNNGDVLTLAYNFWGVSKGESVLTLEDSWAASYIKNENCDISIPATDTVICQTILNDINEDIDPSLTYSEEQIHTCKTVTANNVTTISTNNPIFWDINIGDTSNACFFMLNTMLTNEPIYYARCFPDGSTGMSLNNDGTTQQLVLETATTYNTNTNIIIMYGYIRSSNGLYLSPSQTGGFKKSSKIVQLTSSPPSGGAWVFYAYNSSQSTDGQKTTFQNLLKTVCIYVDPLTGE